MQTILIVVVSAITGLYALWKLAEAIHYRKLRREAKKREQAGRRSLCLWGFDSEGREMRVRVRVPKD